MKSLLLLFFMIPTAVCAMCTDDFEKFPTSTNNKFSWKPDGWVNVGEPTDEGRQYTLNTIQQELTATLQKIKSYSSLLPNDQMNEVNNQLNKWLNAITNGLRSINSPGKRTAIDAVIKTYNKQEGSIGQAVTSLEQALQPGNNSNPVDALETLMNSLSVSSLEEKLSFDNLSLGNKS